MPECILGEFSEAKYGIVSLIWYRIPQEVYGRGVDSLTKKHAGNIQDEEAICNVPPPNAEETHE